MGGNGVEIIHEAVREKEGRGIGFETEGHVLGTRADVEDRDDFVDGAHGSPDPSDGLFVRAGRVSEIEGDVRGAENSAEFIELDDRDG